MSFNDVVNKYNLKNKTTPNIEVQQILWSIELNNVGIYLRDGSFESDIGIVKLHPLKGTHWVCYINENYFDSYGCVYPKKLSEFNIKRSGYCIYSEYQIQKIDSFCANYGLYKIYLTKVLRIN